MAALDPKAQIALLQTLERAYVAGRDAFTRATKIYSRAEFRGASAEELEPLSRDWEVTEAAAKAADAEFTAALNALDELSQPLPNPMLYGVPAEDVGLVD